MISWSSAFASMESIVRDLERNVDVKSEMMVLLLN